MNILLNNRKETIDKEHITLAELIILKNFTFRLLVTKLNGKLIKKDQRADTIISDGDDVTVLHMISGG